MGYGELPARASMRGYWKLENVNDSSGNARTLTNGNSVLFNAGKFSNAADFGSSGTTKSLNRATNPLSSGSPTDVTFSFWYKLNVTGSSNASARFFEVCTVPGSASLNCLCFYNISGGNISISAQNLLTGTSSFASVVMPADTAWHHIGFVISSTVTLKVYHNGVIIQSSTGSGTYAIAPAATRNFVIGASRNLGAQAWAMVDEFILEEREWSASEIRKYYSQSQGRLVAA